MRITIAREDGLVYVDGRALPIDVSALPADARAVQWDTVKASGWIEHFADPQGLFVPNSPITDFSPFQPILDAWSALANSIDNPTPTPPTAQDLLAYAARQRWEKEVGGIVVNGTPIPTDERTQQVITAAYMLALNDPNFSIPSWKIGPGVYAPLSAAEILAIGDAVRAHVQAMFSLNATVDAAILADPPTISTLAEIDAAFA